MESIEALREVDPDLRVEPFMTAGRHARIRCIDCPGKGYYPGPDETLKDFEIHLANATHRERVERRVMAQLSDLKTTVSSLESFGNRTSSRPPNQFPGKNDQDLRIVDGHLSRGRAPSPESQPDSSDVARRETSKKKRDDHMNDKYPWPLHMFMCHYHPCRYESKNENDCKLHMEKAHGWPNDRSKNIGNITKQVTKPTSESPLAPRATPTSSIVFSPDLQLDRKTSNVSLSHGPLEIPRSSVGSNFNEVATTDPRSSLMFEFPDTATRTKIGKSTESVGQAEYFCIIKDCEYSSTRAYDLERHMNKHFKQKKYPCEYKWCGRHDVNPFSQKDHLKEHLRKVHMRDIPKRAKSGRKNRTTREETSNTSKHQEETHLAHAST